MPLPEVNCLACLFVLTADASERLLGDRRMAESIREYAVQRVPPRYWCRYAAHRLLGLAVGRADGPAIGIALRKRRRAKAA